ncbi:ABC transporter ATP-binding protein [bacterium]|nr:ABC transporter ATP-binding protein [bacterium]
MSAIRVENLVVEYPKGPFRPPHRAVAGISLCVEPGEVVGFLGPNGAGKSTTIKSLLGFIFPKSGRIEVLGHPAGSRPSKRRLGYLPEVALYYPFLSARETLLMYGRLMDLPERELKKKVDETLALVGLSGKEDVRLKHYSKGMQQRVGIAQSILGDPDLMIFDELSSGLDPVGRRDLRAILSRLRAAGRTIFFSSHELSEVELLCDRIIIINHGRVLLEESLEKVRAQREGRSLEDFFVEVTTGDGPSRGEGGGRHD